VEDSLAEEILRGEIQRGDTVLIGVKEGKLNLQFNPNNL
jgi:ATP-dependent Clp protease ATP-binding subunit ClpA